MSKYSIIAIFENSAVGYEFSPDNIPQHLTLVDSFEIDLNPEQLAEKFEHVVAEQKQFEVLVLKDVYYGQSHDIPVTKLELTPSLTELHLLIMSTMAAEGAILKNPHFHNDGFSPHVSIYGSRRVKIGELVTIDQVSLAAKVSDADDFNTRNLAIIGLEI